MSTRDQQTPCQELRYATAYDALFSENRQKLAAELGENNFECKRCDICRAWHLKPIPPLESA